MDALAAASSYGIAPDMAAPYAADGEGSAVACEAAANAVGAVRAAAPIPADWSAALQADADARQPGPAKAPSPAARWTGRGRRARAGR
ncbi:MAG: hypothetical protein LBD51_04240 [Bifidobacteriaceae bacterium]|jgi:hypothetical protein|nr:hypothetical protein [Bifidobacteriaceae bacterium]